MAWNPFDIGKDYRSAVENVDSKTAQLTGEAGMQKARSLGETGAAAQGQNIGEQAAAAASGAGMSKGEAAALGGHAVEEGTQGAIAGETQKAAEAQAAEVENAKQEAAEAEADRAEKAQVLDNVGTGLQTAGTAALSAINPLLGAAGGAIASIGRGFSRKLQNSDNKAKSITGSVLNTILSDERCKEIDERCGYHSKIKDERLLGLLNEIKEEIQNEQLPASSEQ